MRMTEVGARARVVFELEAGPQHASPLGTVHGGILCDVADAAMGCAHALAARRRRVVRDGRAEDQLPQAGLGRDGSRRSGRSQGRADDRPHECRVTDDRGSLVAYRDLDLHDAARRRSRVRPCVRIVSRWISATPRRRPPSGRRCASSSRRTSRTSSKQRGARRFEDADRDWSRKLGEAGLRRPDLAEGVRRRRGAVQPPGDLPRGARRAPRRRRTSA